MDTNVSNMAAEDIENLRVEKMKEIGKEEECLYVYVSEKQQIEKSMNDLRGKMLNTQVIINKCKHNLKRMKNELDILTAEFWRNKR